MKNIHGEEIEYMDWGVVEKGDKHETLKVVVALIVLVAGFFLTAYFN